MSSSTHAIIDLAALRHNAFIVRSEASHSKIMAVIKADAYGHGLLAVAKALSDVEGFAVARVEEAIDLRQAGITKPILVLTGFMSTEEMTAFSDYQLDAVIHSDYQLDILKSSDVASPISIRPPRISFTN